MLVAVEPVVLEGALAIVIERAHEGEVVQFHAAYDALSRRYDAAIVTCPAPDELRADVVIGLPEGGAGVATVTKSGHTEHAALESHGAIIRLLDEHFHTGDDGA